MKDPHILIKGKGNGRADISGIADCDDAILFCRATVDIMAEPMDYKSRQEFISEMFVSVLRAACTYQESIEIFKKAEYLLHKNKEMIGHE